LYFIQPLYSKTCRSFTFPSATGSMWCTVGYFYIHAIRNVLTTTVAAAAAAASTPLSFLFPPGFADHLHTVTLGRDGAQPSSTLHLLLLLSLSAPPFPTLLLLLLHLFLLSSLSFVAHDSKNFTGSLSLDVHPADFISSYILHLLLTLSYRAPQFSPSPSSPRHAFHGIFITQLCHYSASSLNSHNSRNFCLSDTPPSFFRCRAFTSEGSFESSRQPTPSIKRDFER